MNTPPGAAAHWSAARERSNLFTLRLMAWIAVHLGRRVARWVLHPIALYFLCFAPGPRRQSARYLQRALGRPPRWSERYRHLHHFASTVLDRVYFVRGQLQPFDVQVKGAALLQRTLAEGRGAFLLGAHLGSFEALHAAAKGQRLPVTMVMYPENARMIHAVLQAIEPSFALDIIAIGRSGSTLAIRERLDGGSLVGLLGDRHLPGAAAARTGMLELPFLGRPAQWHDGPLRLALLLRRRVIFMVALYLGGARYEVRFDELADFSQLGGDAAQREQALHSALEAYVQRLQQLCIEAPYNWFNFHDFWNEDGQA